VRALAATGARLVLGALFLWASTTKVPDMAAFAESVANYRIAPPALVPALASAVVGIEMLAGVALLANVWARAAAWVIAALLAGFTVGLTSALVRGIDLACGCFGGNDPATWWTVLRDVALLALAVLVASTARGRAPSPSPRPDAAPAR
jgi:putative oxidoreductase